jgi:hypothetical protein
MRIKAENDDDNEKKKKKNRTQFIWFQSSQKLVENVEVSLALCDVHNPRFLQHVYE